MPRRPFKGIGHEPSSVRFERGGLVQRLFSTFPNGWPGAGLLLVRMCLGTALIYSGTSGLSVGDSEVIVSIQRVIAAAGGIFLLAGLWTPPTGIVVGLEEAWNVLSLYCSSRDVAWGHAFLGGLALG